MTRFQWRRNTAAGAASNNAVLAAGEPGVTTDTHVLKVGDGATAWVDLPEVGSLTYGPTAPGMLAAFVGQRLTNPTGLARVRAYRGRALRDRFDIVVLGNSIGAGYGSTNANVAATASGTQAYAGSDNANGWVGQLRDLLNKALGVDPGEGFVFPNDPRIALGGSAATYNFSGPLRNGVTLPNASSTLTLNLAQQVSSANVWATTAYVGIIFWDQQAASIPTVTVGGAGATMKTTPGGSTNLTTTGSGRFVVGYVPANNTQTVVVTGSSSAPGTWMAGFDLVNATTGVHVHRIAQAGYVTGDLVGGQSNGVLLASAGAGNQQDRVVRSSFQWCPNPGLIVMAHWDVNDYNGQTYTRSVTATLSGTSVTLTSGTFEATDQGRTITGTGISGGTTLSTITGATTATASASMTTGSGVVVSIAATAGPGGSGVTPALESTWLQQFLTNSTGTASTGPLNLGWAALLVGGPRTQYDAAPYPTNRQSAYIGAQAAIPNTADANLAHVAALDLSAIWGSFATAQGTPALQNTGSVHPNLLGYGDIAQIVGDIVSNASSIGAVTSTPAAV
jgi:hypothetical protein